MSLSQEISMLPVAGVLTGQELVIVVQDGALCLTTVQKIAQTATTAYQSAPVGLSVGTITDTTIDLSWTAGATNYILERSTDESSWQGVYSGATGSFSDTGLYFEMTYYYRLKGQQAGLLDSDWVYIDATTTAPL